jgi:hypothetical protein
MKMKSAGSQAQAWEPAQWMYFHGKIIILGMTQSRKEFVYCVFRSYNFIEFNKTPWLGGGLQTRSSTNNSQF